MFTEESMKSLSDSRQMLSCDKEKKKAKQKWLPEHRPGFWISRDRVNALLCNIVGT